MRRPASIRVLILLAACAGFSGRLANGQSPTLKQGDSGAAVERLQKLLNVRLDPSPELDVDGDFGDATLATRGKGRVVVEAKVAGILAGIIHCALLLRPAYNRAFGRITVTPRITR